MAAKSHQHFFNKKLSDRMPYNKDPKMVVPVYIRDFLGDYTEVSTHAMRKVFSSFTQKYTSHIPDDNSNIKFYDAISIELTVSEPDFAKTTDELLSDIKYEAAMKTLPTNRIIKIYLTTFDEVADVEYKTNGVRVRVDTDTDFTAMVHSMVDQMHPDAKKFKLMQLVIRGGLGALSCDDHIPTLNFEDTSSDESVDEL